MTANTNNHLLEEFRSSSLNPSLLQSLLHRLLSHPKIHNGFVDVLKIPSVQATLQKLDDDKRSATVKTVELFAFGTIKGYYSLKEKGEEVWTLNDAQLEKLRMLSVASIARGQIEKFHMEQEEGEGSSSSSNGGDVEMADDAPRVKQRQKTKGKKKQKCKKKHSMLCISYSRLASELHIPSDGEPYDEKKSMRQLEDLLIQCIYSNIISAKLDQSSKSLRVEPHVALSHDASAGGGGQGVSSKSKGSKKDGGSGGGVYGSVFSRDLNTLSSESARVEVSRMISSLETFLKRSDALVATLERASKASQSDRKEDELRWREVQTVIDESPSKLRAEAAAMGGGGGGVPGMGMSSGSMMGGSGNDPMEVVDIRRQVKRSKGGHSMMMGSGGGVRFG